MTQKSKERNRNFCFTLNNYTDEDISKLKSLECDYLIVGKEIASTGTKHLQGFIRFKNARFISATIKLIAGWHVEIARGSIEDNIKYCSKEGDFFEKGERPIQGKRTDLNEIREAFEKGELLSNIAMTLCKNYQELKFAENIEKYYCRPKKEYKAKLVYWIWGPTGSGKTRKAMELVDDDFWISGKNLKWWEGYCGQKHVIIDDFRGDFCTMHELLRILDGYPYRVEFKGGSTWLKAEMIIITSSFHPKEIYKNNTDNIDQLLRRITLIEKLTLDTEVGGNTSPDPYDWIRSYPPYICDDPKS